MELHPVQTHNIKPGEGKLNSLVTIRASEVYDYLWPGQPLKRINERHGYGVGEVIAFLYAYPFPKSEWSNRVDEALAGMNV